MRWFDNIKAKERKDLSHFSLYLHRSLNRGREEQRMGDSLLAANLGGLCPSNFNIVREYKIGKLSADFIAFRGIEAHLFELKITAGKSAALQVLNYADKLYLRSDFHRIEKIIIAKNFSYGCLKFFKSRDIRAYEFIESNDKSEFRLEPLWEQHEMD